MKQREPLITPSFRTYIDCFQIRLRCCNDAALHLNLLNENVFDSILLLAFCSLFGQVATEVPALLSNLCNFGNTAQSQLPVINMGDPLNLSFDDIIGDEADYYYTITHHNYDWTPSVLAKTEYLKGVDDVRIMNYTNSVKHASAVYTLRIANP